MKTLQDIFNSDYDKRLLTDGVLKDTFGDLFTEYEFAENFLRNADDQDHAQKAGITSVEKIGHVSGFDTPLSVFEITLAPSVRIKYSRVKIQQFLRSVLYGESAFLIFHYENVEDNDWRFSFLHVERGNTTAAKRFTYLLGKAHKARTVAERFEKLKTKILEQRHSVINDQVLFDAFSVEALTQEFYGKLYNWYLWAVDDRSKITFPNRTDTDQDDRENIQTKMLRLITRLMFVWFIKQKRLVSDSLFDTKTLGDILRNFDPQSKTEGNYYNAILQNLFFATLNQEIADRQFISDKIFQGKSDSYTIKNLYRDDENESWFTFPDDQKKQRIMQLFETVPYLNGGLFDCLDKFKYNPETEKWEADKFYDGFSSKGKRSPNGNLQYRAFVPNCFFFAPEHKEIVKEKIKGEYKDQEKNVCGLIELFGQYNFTVEENSPDDSEVSLDPELLGKVFENLLAAYNPETQDSARKSTGSYYTPREIVDYMVNESLINYLTVKCGHQETSIRALFDDHQPAIPDNAQKVASDLRNIRILDPACGSGAFPMGILLRITTILERLQPSDFNKYQTKIELIKNCIFGIDIQPIAMLICKLRFFITLICDSEYKDGDKDNNFGIIPLPSLETKFVAANSLLPAEVRKYDNDWTQDQQLLQLKQQLITLRKQALEIRSHKLKIKNQKSDLALCNQIEQYIISTATQPDQTKIEQWQREIEKAKAELPKYQHEQWVDETVAQQTLFEIGVPSMFRRDVNAKKRNELLNRIHNCEDAIARERSKSAPSGFAEAIRQVAHWNPYDQNTVSPFFDADWMFGVTEGFDIVIGNPPYVEAKKLKSQSSALKKHFSVYSGTADLSVCFVEIALRICAMEGTVMYITTNKFFNTEYGKSIRQLILTKKLTHLINFEQVEVFPSALVSSVILGVSNQENTDEPFVFQQFYKLNNQQFKEQFAESQRDFGSFDQNNLDENEWSFATGKKAELKTKLEKFPKIKDLNGVHVYRGVTTGYNPAFIISDAQRDALINEDPKNAELIKNMLQGRNIRKWYYNESDENLLFIPWHFPLQNDNISGASEKAEKELEKLYPSIFKWLVSFKDELANRNREETGIRYEWYALQRCAASYYNEFEKDAKIIWGLTADKWAFTLDTKQHYLPSNGYIMTSETLPIRFLLGLLNSKLMKFYFGFIGVMTAGGAYTLKAATIEALPIPAATNDQQTQIINYVDEILSNPHENIESLEGKIDEVVYELYDLSPEEIAIVKGVS